MIYLLVICLDFKLSPCSLCIMFFFWVLPRRLRFKCRRFGTLYWFHLPRHLSRKMEPIEGSETSAFKPQTPGQYPKEYIIHILVICLRMLLPTKDHTAWNNRIISE